MKAAIRFAIDYFWGQSASCRLLYIGWKPIHPKLNIFTGVVYRQHTGIRRRTGASNPSDAVRFRAPVQRPHL